MRLDEALDHWAETFGVPAMVVHCLEQYPGALSLVAATLGIDLAGLVTDLPRVNVSVSVRTAELVRLGKKAGIPPDRLRRLSDVGGRLFGEAKQAESLLSPQERMQILRGADPMTERIFRRYVCAENIYASERFVETTFAPKTVLDSGDLMRIVDQLLMPGPAPTR
jgi:hypothetical protein